MILVLAVALVALGVAVTGQRGSVGTPGPAPTAAASAAVIAPTAVPTPTTIPTPTASPPPTSTPLLAGPARGVLAIVDRMLAHRAELEAEVAEAGTDTVVIPDLLRDLNASIVLLDAPLADLATEPATADLAGRLRELNAETSSTIRRIQQTSPRNAKTYRDGAFLVLEKLEPLPALRAELADLAG